MKQQPSLIQQIVGGIMTIVIMVTLYLVYANSKTTTPSPIPTPVVASTPVQPKVPAPKPVVQTPPPVQPTKPATPAPVKAEPVVTPPPAPTYITVTTKQLTDAYNENEFAADEKYKGKTVQVSGRIDVIEESFMTGEPQIMLDGSIMGLTCKFDKSQKSMLATLKKGQNVTVQGTFTGYFMGGTIEGCRIQ